MPRLPLPQIPSDEPRISLGTSCHGGAEHGSGEDFVACGGHDQENAAFLGDKDVMLRASGSARKVPGVYARGADPAASFHDPALLHAMVTVGRVSSAGRDAQE